MRWHALARANGQGQRRHFRGSAVGHVVHDVRRTTLDRHVQKNQGWFQLPGPTVLNVARRGG
jgi:hypothetical protein